MTMINIKKKYEEGNLGKIDFSKQMFKCHEYLFQYKKLIENTDVEKIEITDSGIYITTKAHGLKMHCPVDDIKAIPWEVLNFGQYEVNDAAIIYDFVRNGDVVLDIGANSGWYSVGLAKNKKVEVHAFEPIDKTFAQLKRNVEINNVAINTYNFGLSDEDGETDFYYFPNNSGNSSMAKMTDDVFEKQKVTIKKLDTFVKEANIDHVDFIKCDVEGAELLVFNGGINVIEKSKPIIFAEMLRKWSAKYNYHPNDIISLLNQMGYLCYVFRSGRLKVFTEMNDETLETNFVFINQDSWAIENIAKNLLI